jgi:hypothetical protein
MFHAPKVGVTSSVKPGGYRAEAEKARVIRELKKLARPAGDFNAQRYFRRGRGLPVASWQA